MGLVAPTACGISIPQPGIEPVSPALEGGFLTTGQPGKSWKYLINKVIVDNLVFLTLRMFLVSPFA